MTKVSTQLKVILEKLKSGSYNLNRIKKNIEVWEIFLDIMKNNDINLVLKAFLSIEKIKDSYIYRRELWNEMKKAIREYDKSDYSSLKEAARKTRDAGRILGRKVPRKTVSSYSAQIK